MRCRGSVVPTRSEDDAPSVFAVTALHPLNLEVEFMDEAAVATRHFIAVVYRVDPLVVFDWLVGWFHGRSI